MIETAIGWVQAHPLWGVAGLVVFSVIVSLVLIPRVQELLAHGHPRC